MALNYSQRPVFPAHTSEDKMVSPLTMVNGYAVEGMQEKVGESLVRPRHDNGEFHDRFAHGREKLDKSGSPDSVSKDIVDLLPSDPFGMDIDISTTVTAITGWLEDLDVRKNITNANEDYGLFAKINMIWNSAMRFQSLSSNGTYDDRGGAECQFHDVKGQDLMGFNQGSTSSIVSMCENLSEDFGRCSDAIGGEPHEAFVLSLSHLETRDLLSVGRVCRSLRSTIREDPLLWRSIHIDQPLNERITDDILVRLTSRAEGQLRCLTLIKCSKITDDGLKRVLETNPKLTKLFVPGCTRLSIEGILNNLKAFKSSTATSGIKHIRTGGFYGITHEHFNELKHLLGGTTTTTTGGSLQETDHSPRYYHRGNFYLPPDDDRAIDVEVCPQCQNPRLIYDCPGCPDSCRACIICVPRCVRCGRCLDNSEYEETFALEYLCSDCVKELPRDQNEQDSRVGVFDG